MTTDGSQTPFKDKEDFPIVGLGASAGGLDALKLFFAEVSADSGLAYVVVVHLLPDKPSMMQELLQNVACIPVAVAEDQCVVKPDTIYTIPPGCMLTISGNRLLIANGKNREERGSVIDEFLISLASERGDNSAAVILSGGGSDGTLGAQEIKSNGGLVVTQPPESASADGMPSALMKAGLADIISMPQEMPRRIMQFFSTNAMAGPEREAGPSSSESEQKAALSVINALLRDHSGHDFSSYKENTLLRRISRRMGLQGLEDYNSYVDYIRESPNEVDALFKDLLIGVTSFFRDPEFFDRLASNVLPPLLSSLEDESVFRVWAVGCSTGEEVYSLAIIISECLSAVPKRVGFQIFGTDIASHAIDLARTGFFPAARVENDIDPDRIKRFFVKKQDGYLIRKEIRNHIVFSTQNVLKDPPFSRLHMLCCRNMLIYLDADAQNKVIPLFHHTLLPKGILLLGSSETIGKHANLFGVLDKNWKMYQRRELPAGLRHQVEFPSGPVTGVRINEDRSGPLATLENVNLDKITCDAVMARYAPAAVLIDKTGDILNVQGRIGRYIALPSGTPSLNIHDLAREGLGVEIAVALREAQTSESRVTRENVRFETDAGICRLKLHVQPQRVGTEGLTAYLCVFEESFCGTKAVREGKGEADDAVVSFSKIAELEAELQFSRKNNQDVVEELQSTNEELKSANEELQSAIEELQSTNEELESSKEEMQSLNEELQTINSELESKVEELSATRDDMHNLLNATQIGTLFVDNEIRVRRFTPSVAAIINLIDTDVGRPLEHVVSNLLYDGLLPDIQAVISDLVKRESEVQTKKGAWFAMRIMPYRTTDHRIDGAVITFSPIDEQKRNQTVLQDAVDGGKKRKS